MTQEKIQQIDGLKNEMSVYGFNIRALKSALEDPAKVTRTLVHIDYAHMNCEFKIAVSWDVVKSALEEELAKNEEEYGELKTSLENLTKSEC